MITEKRKRKDRVDGKDIDQKNKSEKSFYFQIRVGQLIQRLEILGYTLKKAKLQFEKAKRQIASENKRILVTYKKAFAVTEDFEKHMISLHTSIAAYFDNLDFDKFQAEIKNIISYKKSLYRLKGVTYSVNSLHDYLIREEQDLLGINHLNRIFCLRIILATQPLNKYITFELTDLVNAGYVSKKSINWESAEKIIVFTEGSTDSKILKESLQLLYPHLAPLYYFLNFQDSRMPGGAGHLVTILKAFIGSGIKNKIVFLFDNDTAAEEALSGLAGVNLPPNMKVIQYPYLPLAEKYPTYGPTGLAFINVNGLATSIELYLGKDIIKNKRSFPIQWKGISMKTKKYQGEVVNKDKIQELFWKKISNCTKDSMKVTDWSGIRLILQQLFGAFK